MHWSLFWGGGGGGTSNRRFHKVFKKPGDLNLVKDQLYSAIPLMLDIILKIESKMG